MGNRHEMLQDPKISNRWESMWPLALKGPRAGAGTRQNLRGQLDGEGPKQELRLQQEAHSPQGILGGIKPPVSFSSNPPVSCH